MIMIMKMSGKWYGLEIDLFDEKAQENIEAHVQNGTLIILTDDLETFAMEMEMDISDIEMGSDKD